ncbi:helix-turn-helix domain-containing protein [Achromobacter xylosoxidans]|uniref:helix-turn-helix domain-containing protein n=1 Tax=Alcaligenes xylosoxydans xylosoxydans TaxID=85698 RepID=UPI0009E8B0EB
MSRIFGRNLAALRIQRGLTLAELAQHLGFHASYISTEERLASMCCAARKTSSTYNLRR